MSQKLSVVVTGGTGKQGGAVVKSLLERGHEGRAVTRSTESAKARELANAGGTLVGASLERTPALTKSLEGASPLRMHALRPRGRRAHGQRRRRHPLACHPSPVHLFPGPAGRHPPTHG